MRMLARRLMYHSPVLQEKTGMLHAGPAQTTRTVSERLHTATRAFQAYIGGKGDLCNLETIAPQLPRGLVGKPAAQSHMNTLVAPVALGHSI